MDVRLIPVFLPDAARAGERTDRVLGRAAGTERIQGRGKDAVIAAQQQPGEHLQHGVPVFRIDVHRAFFLRTHLADDHLFRQGKTVAPFDRPVHGQITFSVDKTAELLREVLRADQGGPVRVEVFPAAFVFQLFQHRFQAGFSSNEKTEREGIKARKIPGCTGPYRDGLPAKP